MSEQAVGLLHDLGYTNVRDYREGLADWIEAGEAVESTGGAVSPSEPTPPATSPSAVLSSGYPARGPARIASEPRWNDSVLALLERLSTFQLFLFWIGTVISCGVLYWAAARIGGYGLIEAGAPVRGNLQGLGSALYFSFVTATSVGYGDILPVGIARVVAVAEAVAGLLIFGGVVAKLVSHRQDQLVREIHRVTFDERLDRVQSNLHLLISELLLINSACETNAMPVQRIATRLESAVLLFLSELRTTHDLLYQPSLVVEEGVLGAILANLASALEVLTEVLACLPAAFARSQPFETAVQQLARLAQDICGTCVPHAYTPRLIFWMDRIQSTSRKIR